MPKFQVEFTREVTSSESVYREVEAATAEEAARLADEMASEFNSRCPDDVKGGGDSFGDWEAGAPRVE